MRLLWIPLFAIPLWGLPTMVRLGYPNCVSCHVSPQGGGLLNEYGRGIDEAQSRRAGEYAPAPPGPWTLSGRLDQDLRIVFSEGISRLPGGAIRGTPRARFYSRNVLQLRRGFRLTMTGMGENEVSPRTNFPYDRNVVPDRAYLGATMLQYRPREGVELAVGIDQLPMGIYTGDLTTYVKARNRFGLYDTPAQAKLFLWGKRWQVTPYAYAPWSLATNAARESGGGVLAEYDLFGKGRTIVGVNVLHGTALTGDRTMGGLYTRLGFGRWGVMAEHDITRRTTLVRSNEVQFGQGASHIQVFRAFREWLVASAIVERLDVAAPHRERLIAPRAEVAARITPNFTASLRMGVQYSLETGRAGPALTVQMAWKTVGGKPF